MPGQMDQLVQEAQGQHPSNVVARNGVFAKGVEKGLAVGDDDLQVGLSELRLVVVHEVEVSRAAADSQVMQKRPVEIGSDALRG